jgi:hypothetical protein
VLGALTGVSPWRAQSRLLQQRVRLQKKLPEVKKALDTVTLLLGKQARAARAAAQRRARAAALTHGGTTQGTAEASSVEFQLTDNIFAKARARPPVRSVCLQRARSPRGCCHAGGAEGHTHGVPVAGRQRDAGVLAGRGTRSTRCARTFVQRSRTCSQAKELLARNFTNAQQSLEAVKLEVLSLRDSITTTEARRKLVAARRCSTLTRQRHARVAAASGVHRAGLQLRRQQETSSRQEGGVVKCAFLQQRQSRACARPRAPRPRALTPPCPRFLP